MAATKNDFAQARALKVIEHRKAQALCDAKRKKKNAPRRDDVNRAAYYVLLVSIMKDEEAGRKSLLRPNLLELLVRAGFDKKACEAVLDRHAENAIEGVKRWVSERQRSRRRAAFGSSDQPLN